MELASLVGIYNKKITFVNICNILKHINTIFRLIDFYRNLNSNFKVLIESNYVKFSIATLIENVLGQFEQYEGVNCLKISFVKVYFDK